MADSFPQVGILGGGAWGTALAQVAARNGEPVLLWARDQTIVGAINSKHENSAFLPDITLLTNVTATSVLADLTQVDVLLLVVPAQFLRPILQQIKPYLTPSIPLVICAKGVELNTGLLMTELVKEILPDHPIAVLSGPTFAIEVARGLPTAITLASEDPYLGQALITRLGHPTFRPYLSSDSLGAEIGGAVKNVLAIACGIVDGRRLGLNARAALITRGMAEMLRFGRAKGAQAETLMGLSGLGDLVLTCTGTTSRNLSLGSALGEGQPLNEILSGRRTIVEGVATAPALVALGQKLNVELPICAAVDAILHRQADIDETIAGLLARPYKEESTQIEITKI